MTFSTLTSKGQTTIPSDIRAFLGLHAGDKMCFVPMSDGTVRIAPITHPISELKGMLPKPSKAVSIAAMHEAIRKGATRS